jgi:hypothetical protein
MIYSRVRSLLPFPVAFCLTAPISRFEPASALMFTYFLYCAPSLFFSPIFTAPLLTALASVIESSFRKCSPSAYSADSVRYQAILALWAHRDSCHGPCPPVCYFPHLLLDSLWTDIDSQSLEFRAALGCSRGHLLDFADFFAACSKAVLAVMSPPLIDAGARLLIRLCHTRPLDFADFSIPDNAFQGALEHVLNANDHRAHSVLLELLKSLGSRGDYRLAALSVDLLRQNTFPSLK